MKFIKKNIYNFAVLLIFLALLLLFILMKDKFGVLSDRESFENFISSFGIFAPFAIIFVIIIEVIIAPLPGFIPAISAGFIFGAFSGAIYTYIGNVLGSFAVFWLSRKFGRIVAGKLFGEENLKRYERLIFKRENLLLVLYAFPVFPIDIMSGAFGLSRISFKKFAFAISIGFIFYVLLLSLFGDFLAGLYFMN